MAKQASTLELLAREIGRALAPLEQRLASDDLLIFFGSLGVRFPLEMMDQTALTNAANLCVSSASALPQIVDELSTALSNDDTLQTVIKGARLIEQIRTVIDALDELARQLKVASTSLPGITPQFAIDFAETLTARVLELMLIEHLERRLLNPALLLSLFGIVEQSIEPGDPADPTKPAFISKRLRLTRFVDALRSPVSLIKSLYGWGDAAFDGQALLAQLQSYLNRAGFEAELHAATPGTPLTLRSPAFNVRHNSTTSPPGLDVIPFVPLLDGLNLTLPLLSPGWRIELAVRGRFESGLKLSITPPAQLTLTPPTPPLAGQVITRIVGDAPGPEQPFVLLGQAGASRLEASSLRFTFGLNAVAGQSPAESRGDIVVEAEIVDGSVIIATSGGDGFITEITSGQSQRGKFDLKGSWSLDQGLKFDGSAGLEISIPQHLSVGPIEVQQFHLVSEASRGGIPLEVSMDLQTRLGPVNISIERIGLKAVLGFPEAGGNLGPLDLSLSFKPPKGVGLAIDAQVVVGGGFLSFDPDKEEYSGILQLEIADKISVKAIGVLTTRLPDLRSGFSLVAIIFVEGFTPIQLGFGFALTGIGGLIGINRTFDETVLRTGLKNHTLDSVMFPKDPIRNAPQIISNINRVFPASRGSHLFGPMLQISWGTPPLITANLAVVFEIGARRRLLILAQVSAILPRADNELVRLQMDAVGILDFDQGTASLDASLHDSRLLRKFTLTGDMAMRLNWQGSPNFALAVGGLHPAFNPPPGFPKLERIAINLSSGDNPRFRCEAYYALTSNTIQFGARAELFASAVGFSIQGEIGYDVLIQLDPFFFIAEFQAQLQLKRGSTNLFKVRLEGSLTGPRPLHIKGKATFEILWWDVSIRFDKTLVEGEKPPGPEPIVVLPRLLEALGNTGNWVTQLPATQRQVVTLRPRTSAPTDVFLHPLGSLTVKQNVVPLDIDISRFGQGAPSGVTRFTITRVSVGTNDEKKGTVRDFFAPGQYFEMSDEEKLSRPSFEQMDAGVEISSNKIAVTENTGDLLEVSAIEFETSLIGKNVVQPEPGGSQPPKRLYRLSATLLEKQSRFGAAANSQARRAGNGKYRLNIVKNRMAKEGWSVVATDDLSVQAAPEGEAKVMSYTEAEEAMRTLKQQEPARAAALKILRLSEVS